MSIQKICPVCEQHRSKLVSLASINERFHGITISKYGKYIDKYVILVGKKQKRN